MLLRVITERALEDKSIEVALHLYLVITSEGRMQDPPPSWSLDTNDPGNLTLRLQLNSGTCLHELSGFLANRLISDKCVPSVDKLVSQKQATKCLRISQPFFACASSVVQANRYSVRVTHRLETAVLTRIEPNVQKLTCSHTTHDAGHFHQLLFARTSPGLLPVVIQHVHLGARLISLDAAYNIDLERQVRRSATGCKKLSLDES
jgi:hypothetical protein